MLGLEYFELSDDTRARRPVIRCCIRSSQGRCVLVWQEARGARANKPECTFSPFWCGLC